MHLSKIKKNKNKIKKIKKKKQNKMLSYVKANHFNLINQY